LKAAQPQFFDIFQRWFFLSITKANDYDSRFDIQEVTTGSAL
jgi:hypothetical protein